MLLTFGEAVNNIPQETRSFRSEVSGKAFLSAFWFRLLPALLVPKGVTQGRHGPIQLVLGVMIVKADR